MMSQQHDMTDCPHPYSDPAWLTPDRVRRAFDRARGVAADSNRRHPGDAAAVLRSAANFLLQRAAEYDTAQSAVCPDCGDSDLVNRLAWVDAKTHELVEMIDPDDLDYPYPDDHDYPFWCGRCRGSVTP